MYPYIYIVLPSYVLMALLGGFIALCWMFVRLEKYQIEFSYFLKLVLFSAVGCFIGSKILFAITQIPWLVNNFSIKNLILLIPQSGLVFYGGLFGAIFALLWITGKDKNLRDRVFGLTVPAMPLFHTFGRIGCFLTDCCYGKELPTPIAIGMLELTRIPVQLIEALAEFGLFVVLAIMEKTKKKIYLLKMYLVTYAVIRFFDEFLRGDEVRGIYFGLSTAQWISMIIILVYVIKGVNSCVKKQCTSEREAVN